MENEKFDPIEEFSMEDLDRIFEYSIEAVQNLHNLFSSAAEDTGYAIKVLNASHQNFTILYNKAGEDPSIYPFIASGLRYVRNLGAGFVGLYDQVEDIGFSIRPLLNSSGSFGGSVDAAAHLFDLSDTDENFHLPPPVTSKSREEHSSILGNLDSSLSSSYNEVWQIYHGTSADRNRASLFMMRQVFDHFFQILAPDENVRASEFWRAKEGAEANQIYRSERIKYAAHEHIKDVGYAGILAESAEHINDLYKAANKAHKRGELNDEKADRTLQAMDNILTDWIDALR